MVFLSIKECARYLLPLRGVIDSTDILLIRERSCPADSTGRGSLDSWLRCWPRKGAIRLKQLHRDGTSVTTKSERGFAVHQIGAMEDEKFAGGGGGGGGGLYM